MAGPAVLSRSGLDGLIAALIADGYQVIGPTVRDDAIVLAEIGSGASARPCLVLVSRDRP